MVDESVIIFEKDFFEFFDFVDGDGDISVE